MQTPATEPIAHRPARRAKLVVGAFLLVVGVGALAAWAVATPGAVSYFVTPSELQVRGGANEGKVLRLGGRVAAIDRDGTVVRFTVTDGANEIAVSYTGEVPDTLRERTDVIAEGTLDAGGTLVATRVLAKCSSKFVPADQLDEHYGATATG